MRTNQHYKNLALSDLEGKWTTTVVATLIVFLLAGLGSEVVSRPFNVESVGFGYGLNGIWTLISLPLEWGFCVFFLNLIRQQDIRIERLFDGYKDFVRVFLTEFLVALAVFVGILLLIVPGIILALMFSQAEYIIKDDKEIGCVDAMQQSAAMMQGHKWEYFVLVLSFIGWAILSVLTLGIGFLFLAPYYQTTMAHYYEDLKQEAIGRF